MEKGECIMSKKKYNVVTGIKKGAYVACAVAVGIVGAVEAVGGTAGIEHVTIAVGLGAVLGGVRVALNWWKVNKPSDK
jgi:hypothetical protein